MPNQPDDPAFTPTEHYDDAALNRARALLNAMPENVGPYRILERIGGGGMGEVYRAEQRSPIRRQVALKFIKLGMDSKSVIARFEAERQALALMDHPHIAKVFDAGTDDTGRPYFVMEYVKGKPITDYADQNHLTIAERLKLFEQVCQAVQHAHHKGVIHRDLKPANVLVSTQDGEPFAKVIDFGIAKAIAQRLTDETIFTQHDQFIGTPQYMSPEQAEGSVDIDTRTDVYSLGVMLYELLTGNTPFSKNELKAAAFEQIRKMIIEVEPPKPSTRLSPNTPTLSSLATFRRTEPKRLGALVQGELDWIVMKAIDKDRRRRYETPTSFANDIIAHLNGEPVQAAPPSTAYQMQKFIRKNRALVIGASAVMLALLIGVSGTTWGLIRARIAEHNKDVALGLVTEERDAKEEQRKLAAAALGQVVESRIKAEFAAISLQIDLDLAELQNDQRISLLRLARPLKTEIELTELRSLKGQKANGHTPHNYRNRPEHRQFREFVTAAVITLGQEYASLLPQITHDGQPVTTVHVSPDHKSLLTLGAEGTARLWNIQTGQWIATLKEGEERVVHAGYSSDGKTIFTDEQTSIARFWDTTNGKFLARTDIRTNRYLFSKDFTTQQVEERLTALTKQRQYDLASPSTVQVDNGRALTRSVYFEKQEGSSSRTSWHGPVELWDTATGQFISRLDEPNRDVDKLFQLFGGGQWVTTVDDKKNVLIFSAIDGHKLAQLNTEPFPNFSQIEYVVASPSGKRIATVNPFESFQIWNTDSWTAMTEKKQIPADRFIMDTPTLRFISDDLISLNSPYFTLLYQSWQAEVLKEFPFLGATVLSDRAVVGDGQIYDTRNWERAYPPAGRKYHPDIGRFAFDGRFVFCLIDYHHDLIIDTQTEKHLPVRHDWYSTFGHLPSFGFVKAKHNYGVNIRIVPTAQLDVPSALLQLWAQVAVRGELGRDGEFVKWDEQTWERKRQELAAMPTPWPAFPFPGYVATDRLHWLRQEYENASDAEKPALAQKLLGRAEAANDNTEAIRWHAAARHTSGENVRQ